MKVLCIGESLLEITCTTNNNVIEGGKLLLTDRIECGSGHAGNIAYLLGKWGVETFIASMMGSDDAANKIKKEFEALGVRTDHIETSYDKPTGVVLSIVNSVTKNNTIFEISSGSVLKKYTFLNEPDIIVSDGSDLNATLQALNKYAQARTFMIAAKATNEVAELCRYMEYVIFNKETAEILANQKIDYNDSSTLVNVYNKLKQKFDKPDILITLGEKGSVYSINSQIKIMPPLKVDVADANGAIDCYAGAFIYGMGRNFGLEKSIAYSTIAASLSTLKISSRASIPAISEVSNYYDSKFGAHNNPINEQQNNANANMQPAVNQNNGTVQQVNQQANPNVMQQQNGVASSLPGNQAVQNDNSQNA